VIVNLPSDIAWGAAPNSFAPNALAPSASAPFPSAVPHSIAPAAPAVVAPWSAAAIRQYLLVCHARSVSINQGIWCFSLESISGEPILDAECEEEGDLNRLSLLAAVRGLESIDGRGLVSLISNNRYLIRSLDRSLPRWRENDFVWEQFGRRVPVQNADLWRRIDRTLNIHSVTASLLQSTRVSPAESDFRSSVGVHAIDELPLLRFDSGHSASYAGHDVGNGISPSDGLRRWLAGNCDAAPTVSKRGRYQAADLTDKH
jgi:ribonuclease HI